MRRTLSVLLVLALALCCLPFPALAAETAFSDVPEGAWYGQAVALCAQKGVMVGTGEGLFSPEEVLSRNQCVTLALRLYDLLRGGNGVFGPAPEDWGKLTLTLADGAQLTSYGFAPAPLPGLNGAEFQFYWGSYRHSDYGYLCAKLEPAPGLEDEDAWRAAQETAHQWGEAHAGPATVTFYGQTVSGTVECWMPAGNWVLAFYPDEEGLACQDALHDVLYADAPGPEDWWRDGAYYLAQREELAGWFPFSDEDLPAQRWDFAVTLDQAVGALPKIREIDVPDLDLDYGPAKAAQALYEAGVLTGTDPFGTFGGEGTLTRAQAAVMAARILDESQRVTTSLAPLPTEGYTLAYLMDGVPDCGVTYPLCALGSAEKNAGHEGLLTLDGALLPWPGTVQSGGLEVRGDHLGFAVVNEETPELYDFLLGVMDGAGNWVVPLEEKENWEWDWDVLFQGLSQEVDRPYRCNGLLYLDAGGHPVSQRFDWAGDLSGDGRGFVGLGGKIYRIEFAR